MEEKILMRSKQYNVKKLLWSFVILGLIFSLICITMIFVEEAPDYAQEHDKSYLNYKVHKKLQHCEDYGRVLKDKCGDCKTIEAYPSAFSYVAKMVFQYNDFEIILSLISFVILSLFGVLTYLWLRSYELTITDKRIYGKVAWGKRVDLPVDSVSATSTVAIFKGVSVSTSSGKISFLLVKNADEIYKTINDLLIGRQREKESITEKVSTNKTDEADQLKKFKDLLDSGAITQEEFDAKKKQILDL